MLRQRRPGGEAAGQEGGQGRTPRCGPCFLPRPDLPHGRKRRSPTHTPLVARRQGQRRATAARATTAAALPARTAFLLLLLARLASAALNIIHDCDETFNYLEPLHYLLHGSGMQTWEYSARFALRSWLYLLLHAPAAGAPALLGLGAGRGERGLGGRGAGGAAQRRACGCGLCSGGAGPMPGHAPGMCQSALP